MAAQDTTGDAKRAEARELDADGIDDFEAGRPLEAVQKLDRAYALFADPTLGLWSARARVQVGRWLEAAERYRETIALSSGLGDNTTQDEAKKEAGTELEKLQPRIPSFAILLDRNEQERPQCPPTLRFWPSRRDGAASA